MAGNGTEQQVALVLAGGNSLGAYGAGAYAAFHAAGMRLDRLAGSSIGAVNAAIIAGNPPERRVEQLRVFWDRIAFPLGPPDFASGLLRRPVQVASVLQARLFGRANAYRLNLAGLLSVFPGISSKPSLYDLKPMRDTLASLIDFGRLNAGEPRVSILAVDVENGEEVVFDTAKEKIGLDHLLASASLIPDFPPTEINGQSLVDGGLASNAPLELVLTPPPTSDLLCLVVDLFPLRAPRPASWLEASERQSDLMYASQTRRTMRAFMEADQLRRGIRLLLSRIPEEARQSPELAGIAAQAHSGEVTILRLEYSRESEETSMKSFDYSRGTLTHRWQEGERNMAATLKAWREAASR
ncbi:MAG: patatin-like phospholipase family protein [Acetobacteraceae bacterium]|nr:patatin-like phospholipase family protein [Acetobacteraceae bacterium]